MGDELSEIRTEMQARIATAEGRLRDEMRIRDQEMRDHLKATEQRLRDSIRWTEQFLRMLLRGSDAVTIASLAILRRELTARCAAVPKKVGVATRARGRASSPRSSSVKDARAPKRKRLPSRS